MKNTIATVIASLLLVACVGEDDTDSPPALPACECAEPQYDIYKEAWFCVDAEGYFDYQCQPSDAGIGE